MLIVMRRFEDFHGLSLFHGFKQGLLFELRQPFGLFDLLLLEGLTLQALLDTFRIHRYFGDIDRFSLNVPQRLDERALLLLYGLQLFPLSRELLLLLSEFMEDFIFQRFSDIKDGLQFKMKHGVL